MVAYLFEIETDDCPSIQGRFEKPEVTIGRAPDCDLVTWPEIELPHLWLKLRINEANYTILMAATEADAEPREQAGCAFGAWVSLGTVRLRVRTDEAERGGGDAAEPTDSESASESALESASASASGPNSMSCADGSVFDADFDAGPARSYPSPVESPVTPFEEAVTAAPSSASVPSSSRPGGWTEPELEIVTCQGVELRFGFPQEGEELVIGRRREGSHILIEEDPYLSGRHVRFYRHEGRAMVEDLRSRHGTWVNEERLAVPRALQDGDAIKVGTSTVRYSCYGDRIQWLTAGGASTTDAGSGEQASGRRPESQAQPDDAGGDGLAQSRDVAVAAEESRHPKTADADDETASPSVSPSVSPSAATGPAPSSESEPNRSAPPTSGTGTGAADSTTPAGADDGVDESGTAVPTGADAGARARLGVWSFARWGGIIFTLAVLAMIATLVWFVLQA